MIYFDYIAVALLGLILSAGVFYYTRRILVGIMFLAIMIALSGPFVLVDDEVQKAVLLIDCSESMNSAECSKQIDEIQSTLENGWDASIVKFADRPGLTDIADDSSLSLLNTNLESAVFYGMNKIKRNGKIYLFSDLLETKGSVRSAVNELSANNISLDIILPDYRLENEVILTAVKLPERITRNQAVSAEIVVEAANESGAKLEVVDHQANQKRMLKVELRKGLNSHFVPIETNTQIIDYSVHVLSNKDQCWKNNSRRVKAFVHPKPTVCVFGSTMQVSQIGETLGNYAEVSPYSPSEMDSCDLLFIVDAAKAQLTDEFCKELDNMVTSGMGLLVFPGENIIKENILSVKGFAKLLPSSISQKNQKASPDGCVVFIVDTSGSMKGTRLILAKEIVRSSIDELSHYDKTGIVEFYGNRKWAAPIQSAGNYIDLSRAVNRLTAGGGTVIIPALQEAHYGLLNVEAATKHIVVITDGGVEVADYESVLRKISDDNISVSFVLTAPGAHSGSLAEMSSYGGGKFFHAKDRFSIPEIRVKTLTNKNTDLFQSNKSEIRAGEMGGVLKGIDLSELPVDIKYIESRNKFSASSILQAGEFSVLSCWNYGLGKVAFSASDIFAKDGSESLLQNLCRYLYKQPEIVSGIEFDRQNEPFEIKSCSPDTTLARKIGRVPQTQPLEKKKTLELASYFLLVGFVCFLAQVVTRRMSGRIFAVLALVCCFNTVYANYPAMMDYGIDSYYAGRTDALGAFIDAYKYSENTNDKKYALSWAILSSQKNDSFDFLEEQILASPDMEGLSALLIVYALNGDLGAAQNLRERMDCFSFFADESKKEVERKIVDIALVSRKYDQAKQYYAHQKNYIALLKLNLLSGDRDAAFKIAMMPVSDMDSAQLFELVNSLMDMGFYDTAINHAHELQLRFDEYYFDSSMFLAESYSKLGQNETAVDVLTKAMNRYDLSEQQLYEIAIFFEKCGRIDMAVNLHAKIYDQTKALNCKMRIANLEEQSGNNQDAYKLWLELWRDCNEPFMLYQITPRLLDTAAETNSLAELVIELENEIASSAATEKQLDLLIDIYTSINDPFSSIEIVKQYFKSDTIESLERQCHIYRRCKLYGKCNKTLRKLILLDEANIAEYLQRMAILALQRGNDGDAKQACQQLAKHKEDISPEFSAGIYSMLGDYEQSRKIYEDLINSSPDNVELWLLWAQQAKNCSEKSETFAVKRLSELLNQETPDDLFMVAVDAILNLKSGRVILQRAYEQTLDRIQKHPAKIYFYRLAIDVLAELYPAASPVDLLLRASNHASQRRMFFIREAMNSLGDISPKRFELAKLLVYMDWKCSPTEYVAMGKMFFANGDNKLAEYLFRSNSLLNSDNKDLYLAIADTYQRMGDFDKALGVINEALALCPDDLQLLIEAASYHEILGEYGKAYERYHKVYSLASRCVEEKRGNEQNGSKNIDSSVLFRNISFEGCVVTATGDLPADINRQWDQKKLAKPKPVKKRRKRRISKSAKESSDESQTCDFASIDLKLEDFVEANVIDYKFVRYVRDIVKLLSEKKLKMLLGDYEEYGFVMGESLASQYLTASLASKLGLNTKAQNYIENCYAKNPQNRYIRTKLKSIFEGSELYSELAEVLVGNITTAPQSSHDWRELTRIYSKAGCLEKAKWANSYAASKGHFILQTLDYLFLYNKEGNLEKLAQYFRKYQIDCRKKNKYFALRWNNWDKPDGQATDIKRENVYMILSEYPELLDDFTRYRRVVYPDRRDYREFEAAYKKYCESATMKN